MVLPLVNYFPTQTRLIPFISPRKDLAAFQESREACLICNELTYVVKFSESVAVPFEIVLEGIVLGESS